MSVHKFYRLKALITLEQVNSNEGSKLLLLRTFSAHAKVVARDAKEMRNTQDTRSGLSPVSLGGPTYFLSKRCVVSQQTTK